MDDNKGIYLEIANHFCGYAKIKLEHLEYGPSSKYMYRSLDLSNVSRLVQTYRKEGCQLMNSSNYIFVVLPREILTNAIRICGLDTQALIEGEREPPLLEFPIGTKLHVLTGHHRLLAAEKYLYDRWWVAKLFDDGLSNRCLLTLCNNNSNTKSFPRGEIFRNLRLAQILGNQDEENIWQPTTFSHLMDQLLPVVGLWTDLAELICYINRVNEVWGLIFKDVESLISLTDVATVRRLQTLFPKLSSDDCKHIKDMMDKFEIFPAINSPEDRDILLSNLQTIPMRILSFYTLGPDGWLLRSSSVLVRQLLPSNFEGSIRSNFLCSRKATPQCKLQSHDSTLTDVQYTSSNIAAAAAYCQLYLSVLRDGVAPRKGISGKPGKLSSVKWPMPIIDRFWWQRLAWLAEQLGFDTAQIRLFKNSSAQNSSNLISQVPDMPRERSGPEFTTNDHGLPQRERCGLPTMEIHNSIQGNLYLDTICGYKNPEPKQNATALAFHRDIFFSFFGNLEVLQKDANLTMDLETDYPETHQPQNWEITVFRQRLRTSVSPSLCSTDEAQLARSFGSTVASFCESAPGFECDIPNAMEEFHQLRTPWPASEAVQIFLKSDQAPFVLFDYHCGEYAKYSSSRIEVLKQTLETLAVEGRIFSVLLESGLVKVFAYNTVLHNKVTLTKKIIFVGRRGHWNDNGTLDGFLYWIDSMGSQGKK
ncbi:hypothetical protein FQN57_003371 [Myotisia sp. PD_48]|nr:hypothetical protein FQN57_003371 [Myotisia sp. PD_48]